MKGVKFQLGQAVMSFVAPGMHANGVRLTNGEVVLADTVVMGIGSQANDGWLIGSGLQLRDGIECDDHCRVADGVYAGRCSESARGGVGQPPGLRSHWLKTGGKLRAFKQMIGREWPLSTRELEALE